MSALFETCPICGKRKAIMWPEFWVYRRGNTFYCSEMCLENSYVKDRNMIKEARKRRKEAKKMAKMKKDGTPAKKPGPKPKTLMEKLAADGAQLVGAEYEQPPRPKKIETPEAKKVEIVETPEQPKDTRPLVYEGYTVCCIESKTFGRFYWDRDHNHLDWTTGEGEEVSFTPNGWKAFLEELPKIMEILGVKL